MLYVSGSNLVSFICVVIIKYIHILIMHIYCHTPVEPLHDVSVTNLKVTMGDGKTVVLSWREPSYSEVRGFPHYRIVVYEGELDREQSAAAFLSALEQLNVVHNITLRGVSSTTISGIDPKKSYHIRMQVFNSAGESGWTYPSKYKDIAYVINLSNFIRNSCI